MATARQELSTTPTQISGLTEGLSYLVQALGGRVRICEVSGSTTPPTTAPTFLMWTPAQMIILVVKSGHTYWAWAQSSDTTPVLVYNETT